MAQKKTVLAKRSGGKHFSISQIHEDAIDELVRELKDLYPDRAKSINASSTLEWMIEKVCGKSYEPLIELIRLRRDMEKLHKEN